MSTFQPVTPSHLIGRLIGDIREHVVITVKGDKLLAVRMDGQQYVVWTWGNQGGYINVFWGHYYDVGRPYPDAHAAFTAALTDLENSALNYTEH